MIIEGGFHPGPLVKVSGGDTTAAHVRPIPPPFPVRASCAPRLQDHHNNHIYAILLFPQNIWTPQLLSNKPKPQTSHFYENSNSVWGKVSNNHEKEEQEEWGRPPRPRLI